MIVIHLPSPRVSQRYGIETLYEGSMDDESAVGIRKCDPKVPLVLHVSKILPSSEEAGHMRSVASFPAQPRLGAMFKGLSTNLGTLGGISTQRLLSKF